MRAILFSCCFCLLSVHSARAEEVLVFAAASMSGPLDAIAAHHEAETGDRIVVSYGASSTLARQVAAGAPAGVILLANEAWMDHLEDLNALLPGTRHGLLTNRLVLIGAPDATPRPLQDLSLGDARLALALTEAVPAGLYARAALEATGQWQALRPNIVETDNVRAALQLVAIGAARYAITYATDAALEPRVRIVAEIAPDLHPPIRYPVAVTATGSAAAEAFVATLLSLPARNIFTDAGFGLVPE
ncbi:molybdate ABC transporter substrate-binding protein [Jannaschia sp. CCS1]|uniref:molybdate ABC transporter substrate-binding protein n=1 Tax=Jannaschia sp. (strain CCS1) TaxID=290400 RepID=UPI000053A99A|nr:molybdate ABC transporter substrate-binding protein [Jannaschia sp. CCS1]ABD55387.1 molybdenum ABC transporter periplasmic molybdate-binding protein [Jannaschia sp. CCS1]